MAMSRVCISNKIHPSIHPPIHSSTYWIQANRHNLFHSSRELDILNFPIIFMYIWHKSTPGKLQEIWRPKVCCLLYFTPMFIKSLSSKSGDSQPTTNARVLHLPCRSHTIVLLENTPPHQLPSVNARQPLTQSCNKQLDEYPSILTSLRTGLIKRPHPHINCWSMSQVALSAGNLWKRWSS